MPCANRIHSHGASRTSILEASKEWTLFVSSFGRLSKSHMNGLCSLDVSGSSAQLQKPHVILEISRSSVQLPKYLEACFHHLRHPYVSLNPCNLLMTTHGWTWIVVGEWSNHMGKCLKMAYGQNPKFNCDHKLRTTCKLFHRVNLTLGDHMDILMLFSWGKKCRRGLPLPNSRWFLCVNSTVCDWMCEYAPVPNLSSSPEIFRQCPI